MGNLVNLVRKMVQEELSEMARPSFLMKIASQDKAERIKNLHSGHWVSKLIDAVIESGDKGITRGEIANTLGIDSIKLNDEIKALQDNGVITREKAISDKPEKEPGQRGRKSSDTSREGVVRILFQKFQDNPDFEPTDEDITYTLPKGLGTEKLSPELLAKIKNKALGLAKRGRPKMQKESLYEIYKRLQDIK